MEEQSKLAERILAQVAEAVIRTTNAIERLHEEFKRRIKTQTVLPSAETAAMLFWALLASGQINIQCHCVVRAAACSNVSARRCNALVDLLDQLLDAMRRRRDTAIFAATYAD